MKKRMKGLDTKRREREGRMKDKDEIRKIKRQERMSE